MNRLYCLNTSTNIGMCHFFLFVNISDIGDCDELHSTLKNT
jgi:hypothetical protein